jgi:lactate dehydrogenase-like 2-hydroxyacid dehydrogenase
MSDLTILYPDVLSTDDNAVERELLPDVHFEVYGARAASDVDDAVWASAQAMVTGIGMPIDEQVFEKATNLKVICRLGVGYDLIDVALAGRRGVRVCNVPDYGTAEVADHAMALLLAFTRGVVCYSEALRDDLENGWDYRLSPLQVRMRDKTMGIIGLGRIGTACAQRARGFGMDVLFYDPYVPYGQEIALGFTRAESLAELLGAVDFTSIHTPATPETEKLINTEAVAAMKPGLVLVNTARGSIIDLDAAYQGLKSGAIGGLGLDVFPEEPVPADHPLIRAGRAREEWIEGRFLASPHAAFYSPTSLRELREKAVMTCVDYLCNGKHRNCVNAEYLQDG